MMVTYTAYEVAQELNVPYRTVMNWVQHELLNPEGARRGHRRPTTWHSKDMREASVLAGLRLAGFSLQRIRKAVAYLRSLGQNPMSTGEFLVVRTAEGNPADVIKFCDEGEALSLIRQRGQLVMPLWTPDQEVAE